MTKEDNIFTMLNDIEISLIEYDETELSQEEKAKLFENFKAETTPPKPQRQNKTWLAVAVAILLLIAGSQTTIGQRVQATATSIIENIRYSLTSALGNESTETTGVLSFNQTATIGDAKVSIQDMAVFEHRIVFNLLVDLEGSIEEKYFFTFDQLDIKINGEAISSQYGTATRNVFDQNENIYSSVRSIPLMENISDTEEISIAIHVKDIVYYEPGEFEGTSVGLPRIEGTAIFTAETTLEKLNEQTEIYDIQKKVTKDNYDYTIEKFYVHPVIQFIEIYSEDEDVLNQPQTMEIIGTDDQGREVIFLRSNINITDDYKRYYFTFHEEYSGMTEQQLKEVNYLDLQFYATDWQEEGGASSILDPVGESFRVDMNH